MIAADAVANGPVYPYWIDDDRFWYERRASNGTEYRLIDAPSGAGRTLFTKAAIAQALAVQRGAEIDPETLVLCHLKVDVDAGRATFIVFGGSYTYSFADGNLSVSPYENDAAWLISPDGRSAVFLRDHNLWLRDVETGAELALTTDGTEDYAYAQAPISNRPLCRQYPLSPPPEGRWSPDSKRFLTLQVDDRHVPDLAMMEFAPQTGVRPKISSTRTSLPGDPRVSEFRVISIEVQTGKQTEAGYARLAAVRMNDTPFSANLAWWSCDGLTANFVGLERGEKAAHVVAFDVLTGTARRVFSETAETYVELGVNVYTPALVCPLPETNELVWYSERSGHGHLYLYDLMTGRLKGSITSGPWQVRDIQHVDAARREVFFTAAGVASDEDPYVCKPCIASLDGGPVKVVSAEPGDHIVWRPGEFDLMMIGLKGGDRWAVSGLSPDGSYFVETVGAVDRLPRTVLRRRSGEQIAVIEVAEDRGLPAGWSWPQAVKLKAADGLTDTYGLLFKPWGHDPSNTYPVIDYIYGGPQYHAVPKSAFAIGFSFAHSDMQYLEAAQLSALGAFVLMLDGRGTGYRERAFREASFGAIHTASNLEDHIAGIRQLAVRYPSMDLQRVGICGFSAGGYMSAMAALRYGEFFKVAVAAGGNYDQSLMWHCWGERYHGAFESGHYAAQAAKTFAPGLAGKLMLIHGLMDSGCHPAALFQFIQSLIEKDKDVDLVLLPRAGHELTSYGLRRRTDYFVTHLFGSIPPSNVSLTHPFDEMVRKLAFSATPARAK